MERNPINGIVWLMQTFVALTARLGEDEVIKIKIWKGVHMWFFDKIVKVQKRFVEINEARREEKLWRLRSAAWANEPADKQAALAHRAGFIKAVEELCLTYGQKEYAVGENLSVFSSQWVEPMRKIAISHRNEINKRMNVSNSSFCVSFEGKPTCAWNRDEHGRVVGFRMIDANAKWMSPLMYIAREARRPSQVKYYPAPAV